MPDGGGLLLPAGARVVPQMHYNNGESESRSDRTRVALHFARGPIDKRMRSIAVLNRICTPTGSLRTCTKLPRSLTVRSQSLKERESPCMAQAAVHGGVRDGWGFTISRSGRLNWRPSRDWIDRLLRRWGLRPCQLAPPRCSATMCGTEVR